MNIRIAKYNIFSFLAFALLCIGCSSGKLFVLKSIEGTPYVSSISVSAAPSTVNVQPEVKLLFLSNLKELLYGEGAFMEGQEMIAQYRFIQFRPPNRWGEAELGSISIEVVFINSEGTSISSIRAECEGGMLQDKLLEDATKRAAPLDCKICNQ